MAPLPAFLLALTLCYGYNNTISISKGVFVLPGTLYLVATPIGNLDDMPPRVAATFGMADFIAAEDTRVTLRLLNHLGLKKPMVSYYEHALHHGEAILQRIEAGENCALCSDAGMPCISDPGEQIVREAHERGIKVVPIPAASACVTALAASGQPTARFVFEGFLPVPKRDRRERLAFLQNETRTMIFYEAPHKLRGTLDDLAAAFGAGRSVSLCRELTKLHEEIKKTTLGEAVAYYKENDAASMCWSWPVPTPPPLNRPLRRLWKKPSPLPAPCRQTACPPLPPPNRPPPGHRLVKVKFISSLSNKKPSPYGERWPSPRGRMRGAYAQAAP